MTVRRTVVGCSASVLALAFVCMSAGSPTQGRAGGPTQVRDRPIADLEEDPAELDARLTSYDRLGGLPCTTAANADDTVHFVRLLKNPTCAAGISANGRFVDLGPVVLDALTKLMWEKKTLTVGSGANVKDLHDVHNKYSWCVAIGSRTGFCAGNATSWIGQVNAEVFAGFKNWRVPTRDELLGIVNCHAGAICVDPSFGPTLVEFYWSSTELDSAFAWYSNVFNGFAGSEFKKFEFPVRAVRAGP